MENQIADERLDKNAVILIFAALVILVGGIIFVMKNNSDQPITSSPQPTDAGLTQPQESNAQPLAPVEATPTPQTYQDVTELQIQDLVVGTGKEATAGAEVSVHYTGVLTNGQKFDSSVDRGQPFSFPLGAGRVIAGWDQGVAGMKVGGKRKLIIPPSLGYGAAGTGPIPGNATLVFDVELLDVR